MRCEKLIFHCIDNYKIEMLVSVEQSARICGMLDKDRPWVQYNDHYIVNLRNVIMIERLETDDVLI